MSHAYFTDRDLGRRFPEILAAAGIPVERHDDRFGPATPDEEWLAYAGEHGLVAITHDSRIRYKPNELAAVRRYRVALLVVIGKAPFTELANNFVATHDQIESFLSQHRAPLIAKVYRPTVKKRPSNLIAGGSVVLWSGGRS